MKNLMFFLFIVMSFALNAQEKKNIPVQKAEEVTKEVSAETQKSTTPEFVVSKSKAKMEFETLDVDYGTIEYNSDPLRKVKFTNTGTEPLVIENARGSCGCTVPDWPKNPIAPGESATIDVRYDTKRVGRISKSITITTNEENGTHRLQVIGEILPKEEDKSVPDAAPSVIKG